MSRLIPYEALAIFPLAYLLAFSFNPVEFSWGLRHGLEGKRLEPMPKEVLEKVDDVRRYARFLMYALILGLLAALLLKASIPAARVGLHLQNWMSNAAVGLVAAILFVVVQGLVFNSQPVDIHHPFAYAVRRGSPILWVFIFIVGAFSEEFWIAFCLIALRTTGHSVALSVAMTVIVFAAVHYSYGFGGAAAVGTKGTFSALLFLHYGSLIVPFLYHFIGNLGSLYWYRYWHRRSD